VTARIAVVERCLCGAASAGLTTITMVVRIQLALPAGRHSFPQRTSCMPLSGQLTDIQSPQGFESVGLQEEPLHPSLHGGTEVEKRGAQARAAQRLASCTPVRPERG